MDDRLRFLSALLEEWGAAAKAYASCDEWAKAAACYSKAGKKEKAAKMFEKVGDHRRAAEIYYGAKDYLNAGQMTVPGIALVLGYSEATSFYRAFKRATGVTPRKYRAEVSSAQSH